MQPEDERSDHCPRLPPEDEHRQRVYQQRIQRVRGHTEGVERGRTRAEGVPNRPQDDLAHRPVGAFQVTMARAPECRVEVAQQVARLAQVGVLDDDADVVGDKGRPECRPMGHCNDRGDQDQRHEMVAHSLVQGVSQIGEDGAFRTADHSRAG